MLLPPPTAALSARLQQRLDCRRACGHAASRRMAVLAARTAAAAAATPRLPPSQQFAPRCQRPGAHMAAAAAAGNDAALSSSDAEQELLPSSAAAVPGDNGDGGRRHASGAALRTEDRALGLTSTEEEELEERDELQKLRGEVSELRQLLVAQARLVQSQQRHITQMEAAVGKAVVQSTSAVTAASAAASVAAAQQQQGASRDGASEAAPGGLSSGYLSPAAYGADEVLPPEVVGDGPFPAASHLTRLPPGSPSSLIEGVKAEEARHNRAIAEAVLHDRRVVGLFDARYHSTSWGATPRDFRVLPKRIFLVRHAESEGNVDSLTYVHLPDPRVPLTARGWQQAMSAGDRMRAQMDACSEGKPYKLFFYTSPYLRSRQTYEGLAQAFDPSQVQGVQEEVQLREQDFGNFQDAEGKKREKAERLRFGRFFYRFPNGESGADVYDRMTIFEDHLVRDINAGRFADSTSLVLVTHGLALRVFLMRWFHWTVDQFMDVFNPPNAEPLVLERVPTDLEGRQGGPVAWIHTKALYRLSEGSREVIKGCTPDMCSTSWAPRGINPLDPADSLLLPDTDLKSTL